MEQDAPLWPGQSHKTSHSTTEHTGAYYLPDVQFYLHSVGQIPPVRHTHLHYIQDFKVVTSNKEGVAVALMSRLQAAQKLLAGYS